MKRFVGCLLFAIVACAPREPLPQVAEEIRKFDSDFAAFERTVEDMKRELRREAPDFRERTPLQDFDEWVLTHKTREEFDALRADAADSGDLEDAKRELDRARARLGDEKFRAQGLTSYWKNNLPAPYWRRYWKALYEANGLDPDAPDSMLISLEKDLKVSLAKGDFATANRDASMLNSVLHESLDRASVRIIKTRSQATDFKPRKTACVPGAPPDPSQRKAKVYRAESIESFYPADALKRGESGSVILRARVDSSGCGTAVAIVVHSGVESLDSAALQWFETAQFAPKWDGARATSAELTFKVKFILKG